MGGFSLCLVLFCLFFGTIRTKTFNELDVFIVPHSHMDAGWLKTIDQYYDLGVKRIFDSVIEQLQRDQKYTFTLGDIYYFQRWYESQNEIIKQNVQELIAQRRIEIVHGGLVSTDQACTTYENMILNMHAGRIFLEKEF